MARKRIKTLATEWNLPVDEVLASCNRLNLQHAHSEAALLSPEETERVKADLEERANRAKLIRRETLVETNGGTAIEKRLNATVMRRRHTEPVASPPPPPEPFHFEMEQTSADEESFAAPIFEEPLQPEPDLPELPVIEPSVIAAHEESAAPLPELPEPPSVEPPPLEDAPAPAAMTNGASAKSVEVVTPKSSSDDRVPQSNLSAPEKAEPHEIKRESPPPRPPVQTSERVAGSGVKNANLASRRPVELGKTINLTGRSHPSAPSLDEGQTGPKVLGKIDLRKPAPAAKPAPPTGVRPGGAPRPGMTPRTGATARPGAPSRPGERRFGAPSVPGPEAFGPPPPDSAKPGARTIKKKKVVKKGASDATAEREMRGLRVPRKRRALPGKELRKTEITTPKASKRVVRIAEGVTVADLARNMGVKAAEIIKKLMGLGAMSTLNRKIRRWVWAACRWRLVVSYRRLLHSLPYGLEYHSIG